MLPEFDGFYFVLDMKVIISFSGLGILALCSFNRKSCS